MFATRTQWNLNSNRLAKTLEEVRARRGELLDLTASNPTECGFQYDGASILKALITPAVLKYHPDPRGLQSARLAVQNYYEQRGQRVRLEDLILTTSTSEAYSFAFRLLCNPGEEVLVPTPSYPLFDFLAEIQDVKLVRYPLVYDHGWQIDFHSLEGAITPRTRGVIVVHPNNPTGHFTKAGEISKLNQVCTVHDLAIIADEVFLDFSLNSEHAGSFTANQSVLTLTMSGLSKISGLPQMKFSWLAINGPVNKKTEALGRLEVIADTFLSMNAAIQAAAPTLVAQRHGFQQQLMARVRGNLAELDKQLSEQKSCTRLEIEGGWYSVIRVPVMRSDEELALELLDEGVYLHPGHFYDFQGEGYLVVSLITREREFAEGIEKLLPHF